MLTNSQLIGTLINDLNELMKAQASGEHIRACSIVVGMTQKLVNLRKTIDDDLKNREETIENLKNRLRENGLEVVEVPADELMEDKNGN